MKNKTEVILGVILGILGVLAIGYVALSLLAIQSFSSPFLTVVTSSESPNSEVWLLTEGFVDRGVSLIVKSPSINCGKPNPLLRRKSRNINETTDALHPRRIAAGIICLRQNSCWVMK